MAHYVYVEDEQGDMVDIRYYCSDYCAQDNPLYGGWNGAHEIEGVELCDGCGGEV